ncbi:MAG: aminoacyl-histidine dipeptidase [Lachnospiraceae bacterium]|nr:aminoacyl-histidine dipeptidase [Lachnospiraceae bacterium]
MLENLYPNEVFKYFEEISNIPRGTYNEKAISDYLVAFAKERNLEVYQDDLYNVIIFKEASTGYEDREPIILQGHMDMVCEQDSDVNKDMATEPIELEIVDGFVTAKGTTLGGDDGVFVAYALAVLDSDSVKHPRLEVVFTASEEDGMDGASGIDLSMLQGRRLLNIDNEEEGLITVGCAGGCRLNITLPVLRKMCNYDLLEINISGLLGGHSGCDINKGRLSAYTALDRLIRKLANGVDVRLVEFKTGNKINVISNSARLLIAVSDVKKCNELLDEFIKEIDTEYAGIEKDINIECATVQENGDSKLTPLTKESTDNVISLLSSVHQGIYRMSSDMEGAVDTSINCGVCTLSEKELSMNVLVRSQVDSSADDLIDRVRWVANGQGAKCEILDRYPAWQYVRTSPLRDKMVDIYGEMFGVEAKVEITHAGLECGFIAEKIKGIDAVAFGPDVKDIHTTKERLDIESAGRMWDYLIRILEEA